MQQIIGIVGPMSSGKSFVTKTLAEIGFFPTSLSDRIREERVRRGLPDTRETLQNLGDELRKKYGNDILSAMTFNLIEDHPRVVVESLRHPDEINFFKGMQSVSIKVIAVDASQENRFKYLKMRARKGDPETWEDFLTRDLREFSKDGSHTIDVLGCMRQADVILQNNYSLKTLKMNLYNSLVELGIEGVLRGRELNE